MARKGKSKTKKKGLSKHEIKFESRCIDLKRFAYDFIAYSALRFKVPENCICVWEGSKNDYGSPEFCLALFRLIIGYQLYLRYTLHKMFQIHYESNKLVSFKRVGYLLQDAIKESTAYPMDIITEVEVSLSVACELVLFLYSINSNLYLKELAGYWFDCYFHLVKKKFEKEGGLDGLYKRGTIPTIEKVDPFQDQFILANCLPYEVSSKVEHLYEDYCQSSTKYKKKITERSLKKVVGRDSPHALYVEEYLFEVSVPSLTSTRVEASRIDVPENTGLGIRPHEELLRDVGVSVADATSSQNLPVASPREMAKHRRSSGRQRRQKIKSSLCTSVEQGLGQLSLDSSGTKQSSEKKSNISVADDPTPSRNLPSRQEPAKEHSQEKRQKRKSSSREEEE